MTRKAHEFKKNEDGVKVCEVCGYVSGETPRQSCPMDISKRDSNHLPKIGDQYKSTLERIRKLSKGVIKGGGRTKKRKKR